MKNNLLNNIYIVTAITLVLGGCGGDNGNQDIFPEDTQPVQVTSNRIEVTVDENQLATGSLIQGVTNPGKTLVFIRDLTYMEKVIDPDTGADILDADGNVQLLYQGPPLPFRTVTAIENEVTIDGLAFENVQAFVHPATVAEREAQRQEWFAANPDEPAEDNPFAELFSQGVYTFTYSIDNGASSAVEMELVVTVNAVEDLVQEVTLSAEDMSVAIGFPFLLKAGLTPFNATFKDITWASSDETVATVDENGMVTPLEGGVGLTTTISATSADGLQSDSAIVTVVAEAMEPLAVDILNVDGQNVSASTTFVGSNESTSLSPRLYPLLEVDPFDNDITWVSSNPENVHVDENGTISGLQVGEGSIITATVADLPGISQSVTAVVVPPQNLLASSNTNFESGSTFPWSPHWQTNNAVNSGAATFEVGPEYGKPNAVFGNNGLRISSDGSVNTGVTLSENSGERPAVRLLGENQGKWYRYTMDIMFVGNDEANDDETLQVQMLHIAQGGWPDRIQRWWNVTEQWQTYTFVYQDRDWDGYGSARIDLLTNANLVPIDLRFDNIQLIEIDAPE